VIRWPVVIVEGETSFLKQRNIIHYFINGYCVHRTLPTERFLCSSTTSTSTYLHAAHITHDLFLSRARRNRRRRQEDETSYYAAVTARKCITQQISHSSWGGAKQHTSAHHQGWPRRDFLRVVEQYFSGLWGTLCLWYPHG
jgi:hypothetical protein